MVSMIFSLLASAALLLPLVAKAFPIPGSIPYTIWNFAAPPTNFMHIQGVGIHQAVIGDAYSGGHPPQFWNAALAGTDPTVYKFTWVQNPALTMYTTGASGTTVFLEAYPVSLQLTPVSPANNTNAFQFFTLTIPNTTLGITATAATGNPLTIQPLAAVNTVAWKSQIWSFTDHSGGGSLPT